MKGNDIKETDVNAYLVLRDSDAKHVIRLSVLEVAK